ncbi:MAG: hypothetical protein IJV37_07390 [Bacteroidales bacterium]|nr:hypothetical protein [Bacteroidales bacterium]
MKKFFSLIALVGVFAACQPENLTTAFQVANATATLNVTVVSAAPGFSPYVTSTMIKGNPTIAKNSKISVSETVNRETYTYETETPLVLAGGSVVLTGILTIPYNVAGYTIDVVEAESESEFAYFMLGEAAHGHGYGVEQEIEFEDGETYTIPMLENANDYVLCDTFKYDVTTGYEYGDDFELVGAGKTDEWMANAATSIAELAEAASGTETTTETVDFKVSAWALYNVFNVQKFTTTTKNIVAIPDEGYPDLPENNVIGKFSITGCEYNLVDPVEVAHPDHASHYVAPEDGHYHGHGHGDGGNAGGGLVEAE